MYDKKINIIILISVLITGLGCAVSKKELSYPLVNQILDAERMVKNVLEKNLTELGFYIQKGKIVVKQGREKLNFWFSVKYARKDIYLISIKALNGFEALRIYIKDDSILVNDRIKKEVLFGNKIDFEKITGLPVPFLKICFGDIADYRKENINNIFFKDDKIFLTGIINDLEVKTEINIESYKAEKVKLTDFNSGEQITIEYKKFRGYNHIIPGETVIYDNKRAVQLIIKNQRFIIPWYGDIEFVPGANYKWKHI